jgi:hypothetical protein
LEQRKSEIRASDVGYWMVETLARAGNRLTVLGYQKNLGAAGKRRQRECRINSEAQSDFEAGTSSAPQVCFPPCHEPVPLELDIHGKLAFCSFQHQGAVNDRVGPLIAVATGASSATGPPDPGDPPVHCARMVLGRAKKANVKKNIASEVMMTPPFHEV